MRGTLLSIGGLAASLGYFTVSLLGSFLSWRQVSLALSVIPVVNVIAICFVSGFCQSSGTGGTQYLLAFD